jgi:hypothetical protein
MMTVWQGKCRVKCGWRKSCGGTTKGWASKQISSVVLVFHNEKNRGFSRSGIRSLSPTEVQKIHYVMYIGR